MESEIATLREQKAAWVERRALKERLTTLTEDDLRNALFATAVRVRGDDMEREWGWSDLPKMESLKPETLRHVLMTLVERIELNRRRSS